MKNRRRTLSILTGGLLLGLAGCAAGTAAHPASPSPSASATITAADMFARIEFLASDALRGRDTPSPGLEAAAAYIVSEYRRLGLEPAGEDGTFFQRYPFGVYGLDTATVHFGTIAEGMRDNRMLVYGDDFYASPAAALSGAEMGHARLAWVGRLGAGGLPRVDWRHTAPVVRLTTTNPRDVRSSISNARNAATAAGAPALVVVMDANLPQAFFRQLADQSLGARRGLMDPGEIAVFHLTHAAAEGIARRAGLSLAELPDGQAPTPFAGISAHFAATRVVESEHRPPNVVAVVRGSDPVLRDEYVVLSAHMDHEGVGAPVNGDSIYNGADDNASGTAGLMEVAEALASLPESLRPRRSVIFLHVSGEEKGLLGARYFSDRPTVPLERIVANINVDMISRNSPDSVIVIGKEYSTLGPLVDRVNAARPELGLVTSDDLWPEQRFFFRSDHYHFARREVPAIFFFTGIHEDYHRPSDTVDRIDADKAARIARLIYYVATEIANDPQRPRWDPSGLEEVRRLTTQTQ